MHRADQDVDLVALDEAVGVLRRVLGLGFVVELDDLQLAAAELAALLGMKSSMAWVMFSPSWAKVPE